MFRLDAKLVLCATLALGITGCVHNGTRNPIASLDSKQPDKVLFDRAMDAMKKGKYDESRLDLQTLINTYPDSEYIARAKLAVGDSWYAEGGTTSWQQAEAEYKDFITFFPNLPEAAEAQLKVANIHYKQMEKSDRDFTEATRAEDEYRSLIQQFPDSKLVPEARQRLREVQEVLADREFRIGRFYYLRDSFSPAIARLKSLADTYPLYSGADEALYLEGQSYEGIAASLKKAKITAAQAANVSAAQSKAAAAQRERVASEAIEGAAAAYTRIIQRYPVGPRADSAKERLADLHKPIPTPTSEAIAQNQAELESREEAGRFAQLIGNFRRGPDMAAAAKVGEPTLVDPTPTNAADVNKRIMAAALGAADSGSAKLGVERIGTGQGSGVGESAPLFAAPSAQPPAPPAEAAGPATLENLPETGSAPGGRSTVATAVPPQTAKPASPTISGLALPKPAAADLPNDPPAAAPDQVNEITQASSTAEPSTPAPPGDSATAKNQKVKESTSKKKRKHKLLIPF